jgi:peptide-methionine (R)-S-oxide reductase
MAGRRQFLAIAGAAIGLGPVVVWLARGSGAGPHTREGMAFAISRTDDEWRALLAPAAYRVLREGDTEWAFSSALDREKRQGRYLCAGCGQPLFLSSAKFDSGTGWPSFTAPLEGAIGTSVDRSMFMVRTEVHCARCGGHLGHVFPDGPRPTGLRYCMNGVAMTFEAEG